MHFLLKIIVRLTSIEEITENCPKSHRIRTALAAKHPSAMAILLKLLTISVIIALAVGHGKQGRSPKTQIDSYNLICEHMYPGGSVGGRGMILDFAADGDHVRRMSMRGWCNKQIADESPLRQKLPLTKLFAMLVGLFDITFTCDPTHSLCKRSRTHDKSRAGFVSRQIGDVLLTRHHIRQIFRHSIWIGGV